MHPPKFYGLPKIHKTSIPFRPIVSFRGSVTYVIAEVVANILKPLGGKFQHHIQSTKDFVDRVSKITLQLEEYLGSYDVAALFTSVPVDPALSIIKDQLEQDTILHDKDCIISIEHNRIISFSASIIPTFLFKINSMNR